jgi:hypothetical protein
LDQALSPNRSCQFFQRFRLDLKPGLITTALNEVHWQDAKLVPGGIVYRFRRSRTGARTEQRVKSASEASFLVHR